MTKRRNLDLIAVLIVLMLIGVCALMPSGTVLGQSSHGNKGSSGSGSGTVSPGTAGQIAIYPSSTATVQGDSLLTDNGTTLNYAGAGMGLGASPPTACGAATGCMAANEAAGVGTPTASQDYCRSDSTAHGYLCSLNNGAEFTSLMNYSVTAPAGAFLGNVTGASGAAAYSQLSCVNPQTATYQVTAADFANRCTITVASGTFTITLVASGGTQPANGQWIKVINYGSGVITISRSGQNINGATNNLTMTAPSSAQVASIATITSDGTNYFAANGVQNASLLIGKNWAAPAAIGGTTPAAITGTTVVGTSFGFGTGAGTLWDSSTAPSIAGAGCGGSAASIASNNGTIAFAINVGSTPTSGGCTITLPAATTDWVCECRDRTTKSTTVSSCEQSNSAASTNSAVLQIFSDVSTAQAPTASDILRVSCHAY